MSNAVQVPAEPGHKIMSFHPAAVALLEALDIDINGVKHVEVVFDVRQPLRVIVERLLTDKHAWSARKVVERYEMTAQPATDD